jgi:hypothetical protein
MSQAKEASSGGMARLFPGAALVSLRMSSNSPAARITGSSCRKMAPSFPGATILTGGLTNVSAVVAGAKHSLALKSGTVVAWGWNDYGQTNVPFGLTNVIAVAGGGIQNLALKKDGTVTQWGTYFPPGSEPPAATNVIAVSAGYNFQAALPVITTAWPSATMAPSSPGG